MVAGYAVGGGHILHLVCDLTIAADNARFGQTGPRVGSFDGGFGAGAAGAQRRRQAGQGDLVPVPALRRPRRRSRWGSSTRSCRSPSSSARRSPGAARCPPSRRSALRLLKASFNAAEDGLTGLQQLSHDATLLFYMTEEGQEGRNAYVEGRRPDFSKFPKRPEPCSPATASSRVEHVAGKALADGRQAADAAGGDRPGAGRHRGRGRRSAATSASAPSSPPWSAASSSRSGPTSPTTTRTPGAAPTRADRLGPVRVTSSGLVAPRRVLVATWVAFGVAVVAGIYLATVAGVVILIVGAASILAGVLYTGGPRPYGYEGLGELFVFLFFGLVAVNGSYYVQLERLDWLPLRPLARGRLPRHRDPGRQQRPRHRDRPAGRQADPRGAAGPRREPAASTRLLVAGRLRRRCRSRCWRPAAPAWGR